MKFRGISASILVMAFLSAFIFANAQNGTKNVVLIKGNVVDEQTGEFVGTSIQFTNTNGTRVLTKSNPGSGAYQQVLNPNEEYIVMFKDYVLAGDTKVIRTPNVNEYYEMSKDLKVRKITSGMEIVRFQAFEPNKTEVISSSVTRLKELKELLKYNPKVNILVTINIGDSHFKPFKKSVPDESIGSKKKKKNKTITVSADQQLKELTDKRVEAIKEFMRANNIPIKLAAIETVNHPVTVSQSKTKDTKKKGKKSKAVSDDLPLNSGVSNVVVTVGKIMNL